jgi:molybdopterin synthase catalytic subunit
VRSHFFDQSQGDELSKRLTARVQAEAFDFGSEYTEFVANDRSAGAVASFVGRVRDLNEDQTIHALELEHYPGMTEKVMMKVLEDAHARWPLLGAHVVHRVGKLYPGEDIVLVLVSSAHRHDALQACTFIMDHLKTQATFWKKEATATGERWVKGRESDTQAQARWKT